MIKKIVMMSAALALGMMLFSCSEGESGSSIGLALMGGSSGGTGGSNGNESNVGSNGNESNVKNPIIKSSIISSPYDPITVAKMLNHFDTNGSYIESQIENSSEREKIYDELILAAKDGSKYHYNQWYPNVDEKKFAYDMPVTYISEETVFTVCLELDFSKTDTDIATFIEYYNDNKNCVELYDEEVGSCIRDSYAVAGRVKNKCYILIKGRSVGVGFKDDLPVWNFKCSVKNMYIDYMENFDIKLMPVFSFTTIRPDSKNLYTETTDNYILLPSSESDCLYYKNGNVAYIDLDTDVESNLDIDESIYEYARQNDFYVGMTTEDLTIDDFFYKFYMNSDSLFVYRTEYRTKSWDDYFRDKELRVCYFKKSGNQFKLIEMTDTKHGCRKYIYGHYPFFCEYGGEMYSEMHSPVSGSKEYLCYNGTISYILAGDKIVFHYKPKYKRNGYYLTHAEAEEIIKYYGFYSTFKIFNLGTD